MQFADLLVEGQGSGARAVAVPTPITSWLRVGCVVGDFLPCGLSVAPPLSIILTPCSSLHDWPVAVAVTRTCATS